MTDRIDTDAERVDACRCGEAWTSRKMHAPDCRVDVIIDLCDEIDRLRARRPVTGDGDDGTMTCPLCLGNACEEGCGVCTMYPGTAGPDAHRQCVRCHGAGRVPVTGDGDDD